MRPLTAGMLRMIATACRAPAEWAEALHKAATAWGIDTPTRLAYWLANVAHETAAFNRLEENLNYSVIGLMSTWPRRFPDVETAERYARRPERIANRAYALRLGNGDEESGDGWRYRGRGALQITGRHSYRLAGQSLGLDLEESPDLLARLDHGTQAAGWYWAANGLNRFADREEFLGLCRAINGGDNGRVERQIYLERALRAVEP
ncbi:MAG: glycoside hydrolase family 19 protein [Anaerolineae bacterium]